jgi:hypothetical protein
MNMTQGRKRRIFGAITLAVGGLLTALVTFASFVAYSNAENFSTALRVALQFAGVFGVVATVIFVAGLVILATAHGPSGMYFRSRLPAVGFVVLAVVFALSQVFFRVGPSFLTAETAAFAVPLNRGVNIALIAAIAFAALAMLFRSTMATVPRVALFLPCVVLIVLQFPLSLSFYGYLVPQAVFHLTWVVVGILYLSARPSATRVPEASENLAE